MSFGGKILAGFTIALCCLSNLSFAQKNDTLNVADNFKAQYIGSYCFLRTGNEFKTFNAAPEKWIKVNASNFWLSNDSTHWIYLLINNTGAYDKTLKLYLNNVQVGIAKLYMQSSSFIDSSQITGSLVPLSKRSSPDRALSFSFTIASGKTIAIYIRTIRKQIGITLTPVLRDPSLSGNFVWTDYLLLIVLTFLLLIVIIAVIVLKYFPLTENFWFFIYVLFGCLYVLAASGFGSLYIWSEYPLFEENAAVFLAAISTSAFFEFSRQVLKIKKISMLFNSVLLLFSITYSFIGLLGFAFYANNSVTNLYSSILEIPYLVMLLSFVIVLCISVYKAAFKKEKEFWWFVSIFSFYIVFAFVTVLLETGYIKYNYKIHAILLAFGALPQTILTLFFLINRILKLLQKRTIEINDTKLQGEKAILQERLRVSRELHDDMGSTLGSISIYSEVAKNRSEKNENTEEAISKIGNASRELIDKMSDIVWSVNPNNESFEQLLNRIQVFAAVMLTPQEILFTIQTDEALKKIKFTTEQRKNIYLIYKEAIHNIIKYAECSQVEIKLFLQSGEFTMIIKDNGKGFDVSNVEKSLGGNGIKNMQARAETINAGFNVYSMKSEGTTIGLKLKV